MKEFLIKNKKIVLTILIALIIVIMGILIYFICGYFNNKNEIHEISNNNYSFQYDSTWKIDENNEMETSLIHKKSKSKMKIKISELEDELQYKTIDEIFDSLLYNIQKQNSNYKLIYKEQAKITNQAIDGYKILFETDENQASIYLYKQGNRLVTFTYETTYEYFDILLDSVNSIIYSFNLKEMIFDVKTYINIETKEMEYTEQADVATLLNNTKNCEIASSNYLVQYSIPDIFKDTDYDSQYGSYRIDDLPNYSNIRLNTSIMKCNIYEYLDREDTPNIYDDYDSTSSNKENEIVDKFGDSPLSYIYKNKSLRNNKINENISIVYELNQNHIFIIKIESEGVGIPKELIEMIKIKDYKNIASNIRNEKENGFLIGKLKQFTDYTYEKTEEITLKLPESYQEIDKDTNLYEERNYISDYYEKAPIAKCEIEYSITSLTIESELKILEDNINKNLGGYKKFSQANDITSNDKKFTVYNRGYTRLSENTDGNGLKYKFYTNEKVLFYDLQNEKRLVIIIKANENQINDELINTLTNFDINVK